MSFVLALLFASFPGAYFLTGNASDADRKPEGGMLLAGGGGGPDDASEWFARRARGADMVVLRASGGNSYNEYFSLLGPLDSVETFVITNPREAADLMLLASIRKAEAIFLAGGDQWNYVRLWKDQAIESAIGDALRRGAAIGGTSAGLAVLGEYSFDARHDTVRSSEALANPFDRKVAITNGFLRLRYLDRVITDSHFQARDRMGRLLVFLARIARDRGSARGIGVDERTALMVEPGGMASVRGAGAVYFLELAARPDRCEPGQPLTLRRVAVQRVSQGGTFDLRRWRATGAVTSYSLAVADGDIRSSRESIY